VLLQTRAKNNLYKAAKLNWLVQGGQQYCWAFLFSQHSLFVVVVLGQILLDEVPNKNFFWKLEVIALNFDQIKFPFSVENFQTNSVLLKASEKWGIWINRKYVFRAKCLNYKWKFFLTVKTALIRYPDSIRGNQLLVSVAAFYNFFSWELAYFTLVGSQWCQFLWLVVWYKLQLTPGFDLIFVTFSCPLKNWLPDCEE